MKWIPEATDQDDGWPPLSCTGEKQPDTILLRCRERWIRLCRDVMPSVAVLCVQSYGSRTWNGSIWLRPRTTWPSGRGHVRQFAAVWQCPKSSYIGKVQTLRFARRASRGMVTSDRSRASHPCHWVKFLSWVSRAWRAPCFRGTGVPPVIAAMASRETPCRADESVAHATVLDIARPSRLAGSARQYSGRAIASHRAPSLRPSWRRPYQA